MLRKGLSTTPHDHIIFWILQIDKQTDQVNVQISSKCYACMSSTSLIVRLTSGHCETVNKLIGLIMSYLSNVVVFCQVNYLGSVPLVRHPTFPTAQLSDKTIVTMPLTQTITIALSDYLGFRRTGCRTTAQPRII